MVLYARYQVYDSGITFWDILKRKKNLSHYDVLHCRAAVEGSIHGSATARGDICIYIIYHILDPR